MSRSKTIRTLENEVECLSAEVARLRLMVERCESMKNFPEPASIAQPAAAPHMVLPLAGQPLDVLPSIFSGAEGTTRLLKVLLETYPWLLPPTQVPTATATVTPIAVPAAAVVPMLEVQPVVAAAPSNAPAVQADVARNTARQGEPATPQPVVERLSPQLVQRQGTAFSEAPDSPMAGSVIQAAAPLAQYRPKPQENKFKSAMAPRNDWGNETDELDF